MARPKRSSITTSQSWSCNKGWSWWQFAGHQLVYKFLNPNEIIMTEKYYKEIDKLYHKLQCLCTALAIEKVSFFFTTNPATTDVAEIERIGLQNFASSTILARPFANQLPLFLSTSSNFCKLKSTARVLLKVPPER